MTFSTGSIKHNVPSTTGKRVRVWRSGTESALRSTGKIKSEGHEYVVRDGDIINFKFNV